MKARRIRGGEVLVRAVQAERVANHAGRVRGSIDGGSGHAPCGVVAVTFRPVPGNVAEKHCRTGRVGPNKVASHDIVARP